VLEVSRLARSEVAFARFSEIVDPPLTILALLWLPVLLLPMVVRLSSGLAGACDAVDYFVWALFAVEYLVKLYLAPARRAFARGHVVDLAAVALPCLRPLRALRVLRMLKVARAGVVLANALERGRAILIHRRFHFVLLAAGAIVVVCAALDLAFEGDARGSNIHTFAEALWWALVTVTTVGYGDHYPVTAGGHVVAVVLMLVGIGLIGVLTATIASYFVEDKAERDNALLTERLDRIEAILLQMHSGSAAEAPEPDPVNGRDTTTQSQWHPVRPLARPTLATGGGKEPAYLRPPGGGAANVYERNETHG
jgi:voltage-gated potassium channel